MSERSSCKVLSSPSFSYGNNWDWTGSYTMIRTGDLFDSMPEEVLNRKLAQYGLM
ncbi:hypothetical protein LEP1GSC132_0206 [Leptospira kirschneri str. 200803703]|uniref:Uncharacterized protein n=1 Tax=Leptospira kirschneri str. 200802841 TaxID=1193047 RepID=A0A828Y153_9LEPT|nr:hypothetical protein LEP1GSC131_3150 [Leptospira kirschneri str. 200802841]EMO65694.1 hypothetical protein LEP1GSC132_0206 [Leptospira kirschneri str. 200803703]EMO75951.1 hypothetical protein LEP1GSC127_0606 [Leptospira kirschneri str. 200801925]